MKTALIKSDSEIRDGTLLFASTCVPVKDVKNGSEGDETLCFENVPVR